MKKLLLLTLLFSFSLKTKAQVAFCPPGAEWHYNFVYYFAYYLVNEKVSYAGDSVVAGVSYKKLRHTFFF